MKKKLIGNALLLLTAFIWGSAFVAQSIGMEHIGPFTFNALRSLLGSLVLMPVILVRNRKKRTTKSKQTNLSTLKGGIICGIILFFASSLQQIGIQYTTVGKASFITALYIVLVPIFSLFIKKRPSPLTWIAVVLSAIGLYMLCIRDGFSIGKGDALILGCAFLFTFHILVIDYFIPYADSIQMSCIQFILAGILGALCMFIFETPTIANIQIAWVSIAYAGILSCGVAYTLQIVAQKDTDPTVASLLLSLESVFGALAGWLVLGESFTIKESIGMALMLCAIVLAQLPVRDIKCGIDT